MLSPDLGGVEAIARMPGTGIVDGDVGGRDKAGMQHSRILGSKAVQSLGQKSHDLALGDADADIVQSAAPSSPVLARAASGRAA